MTFALSKILWPITQPSNLLLLLLVIGLVAWRARDARWGRRLVTAVGLGLAVLGLLPVGSGLLHPLESRFPQPRAMPAKIDGIVVLGGAIQRKLSQVWGRPALNERAERMTAALALARRYPAAKLVFTGGIGGLSQAGPTEAEVARAFFAEQGLDPARILFEHRSRNTYENAIDSYRLVHPAPGQIWLLVTSAFHMPRALGVFRQAGWTMIPYPVDYQTTGGFPSDWQFDVAANLARVDLAARAWLGLVAYRLMGRTDALWPASAVPDHPQLNRGSTSHQGSITK